MSLRLVPLALVLGTSSALAFDTSKLGQWGSLPLDDLKPVFAKSARLQQEISKALSEANKKLGDVQCVGMRFPGPWKNLGGTLSLQEKSNAQRAGAVVLAFCADLDEGQRRIDPEVCPKQRQNKR